jgi:hypothetical protein
MLSIYKESYDEQYKIANIEITKLIQQKELENRISDRTTYHNQLIPVC